MEGGILERDLHDVVSSWLAHKNPIPEGWKGETSPMYALGLPFLQVFKPVSSQKTDEIS